jgi:hypothetical protein
MVIDAHSALSQFGARGGTKLQIPSSDTFSGTQTVPILKLLESLMFLPSLCPTFAYDIIHCLVFFFFFLFSSKQAPAPAYACRSTANASTSSSRINTKNPLESRLGPSGQGKNDAGQAPSIHPPSVHRPGSSHASRLQPGRTCQPVRGRLRHRLRSPQQAGALTVQHDPIDRGRRRARPASKAIGLLEPSAGIQMVSLRRASLLFSDAHQIIRC